MNNEYDYKPLPPFKWFVLQNFPFIDADFDAITNYQLFCKVVEYLNKVIESQNEVGEQVELLTNSFNTLKAYVDNYFDNLDVQEEINNKLDEMVEQGTLQEIIADYLNSKAVFGYDNVAGMKVATNLIDGSYAKTLGYFSKNDGGQSLYKIREITNQDVVDEKSIIALSDENLIAELIVDNVLNVKQFGAKGDSTTDDTSILNSAIDFCNINKKALYLPKGTYLITEGLNKLITDFKLYGDGKYNSIIKLVSDSNADVFDLENQYNIYIHDIGIITDKFTLNEIFNETTLQQRAINTIHCYQCVFENLDIMGFFQGIGQGYYSWINKIVNCTVAYCTVGIIGRGGESNSYNLDNVNLEFCNTAVQFSDGFGNSLHNCCIENNNNGVDHRGRGTLSIHDTYFENNETDLNVYSSGVGLNPDLTLLKNCYVYATKTTPRIKVENPNYDSIINIENNYFRCRNNVSSQLLGYYKDSGTQYSNVILLNNHIDENMSIGVAKVLNNLNMNNGISCCSAKLNDKYTIQATNTQENLALGNFSTVGKKLTINNSGEIVIGENLKKIKVSACMDFYNVNAGTKLLYLVKNGTNVTNLLAVVNERKQIVLPDLFMQVSQGDRFTIGVYGTQGDILSGGSIPQTYLTIEEIL